MICVDGPTASGKGTLAAELAHQIGFHYLDSGALYRIIGLAARRHGFTLDAAHEHQIAALASDLRLQFSRDTVLLAGADVSELIRSEAAGMDASSVAVLPAVREALVALQKGFRRQPGLVADGRDMGTVIFPDSPLKIFLVATAEKRASRRHKQLAARGVDTSFDMLRAELEARDARDSSRAVAPLKPAADARLLDNSDLSIAQSVDLVLGWWREIETARADLVR